MKNSLKEYITNDDGRLSRSQTMIVIVFCMSVVLLVAHIVCKLLISRDVLDMVALFVLISLAILALIDRMNARNISMRIGIAQISAGSDGGANGQVDSRYSDVSGRGAFMGGA